MQEILKEHTVAPCGPALAKLQPVEFQLLPNRRLPILEREWKEGPVGNDYGTFEWIHPAHVGVPFSSLLVHEEHLTGVLESRHGKIDVRVAQVKRASGGLYSRKIYLHSPCGKAVAHAILHAYLDRLPPAVTAGVCGEKIPFGKLLMDHVKERCVKLKACWRVKLGRAMAEGFGITYVEGQDIISYGRTVIIECDGQAAAEVLEVMAPTDL